MARPTERRGARGFSLIELLVALAVFALVVVGLLNLSGESVRTAVHVEESVLAGIVAANVAAEAQLLEPAALAAPLEGSEALGGRDWHWRRTAVDAGSDGMVRVDVEVRRPGGDGVAASASVFR
ncbi:general secretion pathway protein I [Pseudoxanthomonas suwonensis 11-1]|jgi:general secretion pathway protein I|uniref:Type II secretion system protein I n=1 Tax=Pseudoxanthomonas suwonensis (strain 11-1) TaxID=743721 RepID=E6WR49_PSEUU|nr:type II secretion system minor pseudopilin GspI [Pseudoxanthomonas suwonensis]ADV26794.1 general secretion pathway protein I [Pseudoxanthomonas suwonensis 11-1]